MGTEHSDDAGVYRLNDETALIQTVDFFTPVVNDPYRFGQIGAANALSDVYAMGGKPLLAMNLLGFPVKKMDSHTLKEIIRGGLDKIHEAGALLVGGHSIEDDELKYGLSVTGTVHPDRVITNGGARPGDQLLLTKPIGTGILATALKGEMASSRIEVLITQVMSTLNKIPGECMAEIGAHACTDVTGFGLIGHLYEMAAAANAHLKIDASAIPILPEVETFASMGIIPEGAHKNRKYFAKHVSSKLQESDPLDIILYDPQTSGGLLIAAPPDKIKAITGCLAKKYYPLKYAVIGEVDYGPAATIEVL